MGNNAIFFLDENNVPVEVAGCPPDAFSETGQLWGNPIYDWEVLEKQNFDWWVARIKANLKLYDIIRIDHFRALNLTGKFLMAVKQPSMENGLRDQA